MINEQNRERVLNFLKGNDFMRLGMAIEHDDTNAAMMILTGLQRNCGELGINDTFETNLNSLRMCVIGHDKKQAQDILALVTSKRVALEKSLSPYTE